ncbi:hypothetical protein B7P43_G15823 [Cryptotermes secundus]|uniref:BED-type domain-containing protein n=1 Tax=Cryptotermes secundus TaxID=105785 RepID=A0A2J7PMI3_9NEOP|nr:hypothetical protein B7P43_G15823 [Cryptotermes secundus]
MFEGEESPSKTPPRKKLKFQAKHNQIYLKKWGDMFSLVKPGPDENRAFCTLCRKDFSISHGGQSDLRQHAQYKGHKIKEKCNSGSSNKLSKYFANLNNNEEYDNSTAVELGLVYHAVKHNLSYSSLDCGNKLVSHIFSDPAMASKLSCGRTKVEMIVKYVLAPKSVNDFVAVLRCPENTSKFFSLATNASNRSNRKMFPVCIRYFDPLKGVQNKLLDFVESAEETSMAITGLVLQSLEKHNLDVNTVSSYCADTANANYGKTHSLYQLLRSKNPNLLKANCSNHIIHNTIKFVIDRLDVDVETVVLKICNHFSVSAKRREELKPFSEFLNLEWTEIMRHVPTRWLSLTPAISRLLQNWEAMTSYFNSIPNCPKLLSNIFMKDDPEEAVLPEIYFNFLSNIGSQLKMVGKTLERSDLSALET